MQVGELLSSLGSFVGVRKQRREQLYAQREAPRPTPIRGTSYDRHPAVPATTPGYQVPVQFESLYVATRDLGMYTPYELNSNDQLPSDRTQRRKFIMKLRTTPLFDVPFVLFYYHQGGTLPMLYWIWKCGQTPTKQAEAEVTLRHEVLVAELVADIPKLATRLETRHMRKAMDLIAQCTGGTDARTKRAWHLVSSSLAIGNCLMTTAHKQYMQHLLNYDDPEVPPLPYAPSLPVLPFLVEM